MSDFLNSSSLKRLGLDEIEIDTTKSFEIYDPITNNHTLIIYLFQPKKIICQKCGCLTNCKTIRTKTLKIKWSCESNTRITIFWHRKCYKCESCQKTFYENNPFVMKKNSISISTRCLIIDKLKLINLTYKNIGILFNISTTKVMQIFDNDIYVKRRNLSKIICLDEVYAKRLSFHKYCFIIYSPVDKKIIDVIDSRRKNRLDEYFQKIPWQERKIVEYISIDLYEIYRSIARKFFPLAKLCADPFHVIKNLYDCFDDLRNRTIKRVYESKMSNDYRYKLYKKYWRFLNKPRKELSDKTWYSSILCRHTTSKEIVQIILTLDDELKEGYKLLHLYREFNETKTIQDAESRIDNVCWQFYLSNIPEMKRFYSLLKNWKIEIINSFSFVDGKRITNGPMERINRDIKLIFNLGFGMRNFERTRKRIMYVINNKER